MSLCGRWGSRDMLLWHWTKCSPSHLLRMGNWMLYFWLPLGRPMPKVWNIYMIR
uniref:Uncharacterized protein n=1 Tax=Kalanchoe fedtschenkoi TaxID=63787 RepID=A0A7N0ZVI6_KALFE